MATKIGIIGIGNISGIYLENITKVFNKELEIVGVCDLRRERAENARKITASAKSDTMYDCSTTRVEVVLNLTRPTSISASASRRLRQESTFTAKSRWAHRGKRGLSLSESQKKGLWMGGAPDTFMGAGIRPPQSH